MADSLQEQLRKAGLVNEKKLKKAQRVKHAQEMERKTHGATDADPALVAQRARAEKAAHDRALNEQRDRQTNAKALAAQIRQLIELNRQPRDGGDIAFNFKDGRAIRKMLVTRRQQDGLASGRLAIVKLDDRYELVPYAAASKIRQRDPATVILCHDTPNAEPQADDPYAKFKVPDDLDW